MRTSGTVITCPSRIGSCTAPRVSISASAWRIISPTRSCRCDGPERDLSRGLAIMASGSQTALNLLHPVALDDVADFHVLIVLEGHPTLLAGDDLLDVILEAPQLRELAFVDDHVVTDEAHIRPTLDASVSDATARNVPDLGDLEDFQHEGIAERRLPQRRGQQARHCFLHVIHEIVDDVVIADLDAGTLRGFAGLLVGTYIEAYDRGVGSLGEPSIRFGDAADAGHDDAHGDFGSAKLLESAD